MGILKREIKPNKTSNRTPTVTVTGFFIAVSMSFIVQNNDAGKIHHEIGKVRKHENQYTFKKNLENLYYSLLLFLLFLRAFALSPAP